MSVLQITRVSVILEQAILFGSDFIGSVSRWNERPFIVQFSLLPLIFH